MARLISYPTISTVASGDLFPVTDISDTSKPLKNITAVNLQKFVNDGATLQRVISTGNTYQASPSDALWTWGTGAITATSTSFTSLLSGKRFKTTLIADGSYTDVLPKQLIFNNASGNETSITPNTLLSSNIDLQWPSSSGTLALTTDIPASPWDTVTGGINYAGGNVGVGTVSPSQKLEVNGDAKINGLTVGKGPGSLSQNVVLGVQALASNTTGNRNLAIGPEALEDNTTGANNVAIGWVALQKNQTSSLNTAVGAGAIGLTQGGNNTAIGYAAGYGRVGGTNASGVGSVFVGKSTTSNGIGSVNEIVIGTDAISAGSNTVVLGNDLITSTRLKGDVIVANGSVGIGTTSPTYKLDVLGQGGAARFISVSSTALEAQGGANAQDIARFKNTLGDVKFVIDTNGDVGIGTASPTLKLDINSGTANSALRVLSTDRYTGIKFEDATNNDTLFYDGQSDLMYLSSTNFRAVDIYATGNVGIGTTSPGAKLEINSVDNIAAIINSSNTFTFLDFEKNGANRVQVGNASAGDFIVRTSDSERMRITSAGNVGIGTTSPGHKLTVIGGNIQTDGTVYTNVIRDNTGGDVSIQDNGGNVGIGTTSPASKLEVDGGDIEVDDSASGLILRSPDGTRYRITVANGGTLAVTAV